MELLEPVYFEGGGFYPYCISGWECTPYADSEYSKAEGKVVGNIYDNPELKEKLKNDYIRNLDRKYNEEIEDERN